MRKKKLTVNGWIQAREPNSVNKFTIYLDLKEIDAPCTIEGLTPKKLEEVKNELEKLTLEEESTNVADSILDTVKTKTGVEFKGSYKKVAKRVLASIGVN